jgi:Peptidase family U32
MRSVRDSLSAFGLPAGDLFDLPTSAKRFEDGAQYRIEIPSTEGSGCFLAVLDEADSRGVVVSRVSQGSGVLLLTDDDLDEMAELGRTRSIEVSLASRPNAGWHTSAMARSSAGALVGATAHGQEQVIQQLTDIRRAAAHGIRSVLITDIGTLSLFGRMRASGDLPSDMQAKVSVLLPAANATSARVLSDLGASTINVPTDLSLAELAAIRAAVDCPIDIYIESADEFGGILRYGELADIVRVAAPVYLKLGLRNAPDIYPTGGHMNTVAIAMSRERVRRAQIALEILGRGYPSAVASGVGAAGLAQVVDVDMTWLDRGLRP